VLERGERIVGSGEVEDLGVVRTGRRAASARKARPSSRVLLATVRTTRSP